MRGHFDRSHFAGCLLHLTGFSEVLTDLPSPYLAWKIEHLKWFQRSGSGPRLATGDTQGGKGPATRQLLVYYISYVLVGRNCADPYGF